MLHIINKAPFALVVKLFKYRCSTINKGGKNVCVLLRVYLEQQEARQVAGV